ncbi:YceI family protein [Actinomadura sp. DC4]|uniref:YceI family protein n=1 Tax=Actinomadura sp. DC4 TaxID=3055069 RepID=UPI0025AF42BB|nr:YceI family protein [Actinomadura sp. DC4]MDN3358486.1 YceI family protein [Actinomadura sp. DC4]
MTTITDTTVGPQTPDGWAAGTWTIDPAHTVVSFSVRHLMSRVRGTFTDVSGQIVTDLDSARSAATAVIATASVNTGNQTRDGHLRSADFFDAERYPRMRFASRALRPVAGSWTLSGELTIRDVTRPVDLEVEFLGSDPTGLQGEPRIGFSARATLSRRDFGITFGLVADGTKIVVADEIDIALDIEAFLNA